MALVNQAKREINSKLVFFGPGLAGKATNVRHIYHKLKPDFRGAMKAMNVQEGRMLFFDFTPPGDGNVDGFKVRFHLYTVSGNVVDPAAWKMVLKGVDGIVFVADSQPQRQAANRESLDSLNAYLKGYGQSLSSIPVVFQYNKSDTPDAVDTAELDGALNPSRFPSFRASSQNGDNVLQTLLSLVKTVLGTLRSKGLGGLASAETLQRMVEPAPSEAPEERPPLQEPAGRPQPPQPQPPEVQPPQSEPRPVEAEAPQGAMPPREEALAPAHELPAAAAEGSFPGQGVPEGGFGETGAGQAGGARETGEEALSLELSGPPRPAGPGQFSLPLTIRSGARTKSVLLTVAVSVQEE